MTTKQKINIKGSQTYHPTLVQLLTDSKLPKTVIDTYFQSLTDDESGIGEKLNTYFEAPEKYSHVTPIIIYHEENDEMMTLFTNNKEKPEDPGEEGSILAYARTHSISEEVLCSDCYGQLSCSSCAVEILAGSVVNPTPREEEYDMLDIDEAKPPTEQTRLSCQSVVGTSPLVLKIRKPL